MDESAEDPDPDRFANVADGLYEGEHALEPTGLSPELELVAQLLADGYSDATAASFVNRSAKFVQRVRRSNPAFVGRVRDLRESRAAQAAAGLGSLLNEAVEAVNRGLRSERITDQLRAAALVFDRYPAFYADSEAKERVRQLQEELDDLREDVRSAQADRATETDS